MDQTIPNKKTILHLPRYEAEQWCLSMSILLANLCVSEGILMDKSNHLIARSIEGYMHGDRRRAHGSPHIKRVAQLQQGDHMTTLDLMVFLANIRRMFKGERCTPFENEEMSQDEARSWLAEMRQRLMLKLRHDRAYLRHCERTGTTAHKYAATPEQINRQEDIVLLLNELLKTHPPLKVSRPKNSAIERNV
jgi:hypothetical protein